MNLLGKNHVVFIGNFEFRGKCFGNLICLGILQEKTLKNN